MNTAYANMVSSGSIRQRTELKSQRLRLDIAHLAEAVAENQLLPRLDLIYRYEMTGAEDGYASAWEKQWHNDTTNHLFGLSLEMPIGNRASAQRIRRSVPGPYFLVPK